MHFVSESATSTRELRKAETARGLKEAARRLTAERGLSGFTLDEVCEDVGVSRRTFFNYFASKENAVIGIPLSGDTSDIDDAFRDAGPRGIGHLIDDLLALHLARWEVLDLRAADVEPMTRIFEREPRLISHMLQLAGEGQRTDIGLVEQREGLEPGDLRAAAAVQIVGAIFHAGVEELFRADSVDDLGTIVRRRLAAGAELFHA
jgi:AcrR family transcriptional regulator